MADPQTVQSLLAGRGITAAGSTSGAVDPSKVKELATQFEAMLLSQMLKGMQTAMMDGEESTDGFTAGPLGDVGGGVQAAAIAVVGVLAGGDQPPLLSTPDEGRKDPEPVEAGRSQSLHHHRQRARERLGHSGTGVVAQVRCFSCRGVGVEPEGVAFGARTARRVASTTVGRTSAGGLSTAAPDALMCPPPPNSRASAFTSTAPVERNEIFVPPVDIRRKSSPTSTPTMERG